MCAFVLSNEQHGVVVVFLVVLSNEQHGANSMEADCAAGPLPLRRDTCPTERNEDRKERPVARETGQHQTTPAPSVENIVSPKSLWPATPDAVSSPELPSRGRIHSLSRLTDAHDYQMKPEKKTQV